MNILGISAFYHESACCLLQDGRLVAAACEERFSRVKHDPSLPLRAARFCLQAGGISLLDVDALAYYELPARKVGRQLWAGPAAVDARVADRPGWLDPRRPEREFRESLGYEGEIVYCPHHESHAASAYFFSGFDEAAVLTADGVGEWATTTYGRAQGDSLEIFEEVRFPHSLGLLYSTITAYLGFRVNSGEYKVMGLAPYGQPRYVDQICQLIGMGTDGQFLLNMRYFEFLHGRRMFSDELLELFGRPARLAESEIESFHHDVARSLQLVVEEVLLEKAGYLATRTGSANLCLAGGVALNCVANGRLRREGPFESIFVQPAAGDAGGCVGAAALAHRGLGGASPPRQRQRHAGYGPSFEPDEVYRLLEATGVPFADLRGQEERLIARVADALVAHRVVGWFHGAMEFGPRALGGRSILANPLDASIRQHLNARIKRRESFRPFAPCVLATKAAEHFDLAVASLSVESPFMLETCQVTSPLELPGITHVDGSARPQTVDAAVQPRLAALLAAFEERTGCPILVNTSFNLRGEPIVCTPQDALFCFGQSGIDLLVLEDCLIEREDLPADWPSLFLAWLGDRGAHTDRQIGGDLYTFV